MKAMVTPQPTPKAEVSLWKYNDLRPLLLEAGQAVTSHQAERRVLMLINPALSMKILPSFHLPIDRVESTVFFSPVTLSTMKCSNLTCG